MDKIFLEYLNEIEVFKNVKLIDISVSNFHKFNELKIIFPNVEH